MLAVKIRLHVVVLVWVRRAADRKNENQLVTYFASIFLPGGGQAGHDGCNSTVPSTAAFVSAALTVAIVQRGKEPAKSTLRGVADKSR
jgi:hypothetical protein